MYSDSTNIDYAFKRKSFVKRNPLGCYNYIVVYYTYKSLFFYREKTFNFVNIFS